MTARSDSGSSRSPSAVEDVASQNRTVTVLRVSATGSAAAPSGAAHEEQNRDPG